MSKTTKQSVSKALAYAKTLVGVGYCAWDGRSFLGNHGPFWVAKGRPPSKAEIRKQGCVCAGLINLVCRHLGLPIAGLDSKHPYAGGTRIWFKFLRESRLLNKFDHQKVYPKGTLLLRNYKNKLDQGHLAIVYSENSKGVLFSKVIHAHALDLAPQPGKFCAGGVSVNQAVGASHFWIAEGYYTHVCLPENWLG